MVHDGYCWREIRFPTTLVKYNYLSTVEREREIEREREREWEREK